VDGVCTVQLRAERIYSNQVFFDRSPLLAATQPMGGTRPPDRGGGR
jgi:hypothetical protein